MIDATEYGRALFELCSEKGNTDSVLADLNTASEAFAQNPAYVKLLDTPALAKSEKLSLAKEAFSSLDEYVLNFIMILCERHSIYLFPKVLEAFSALYDEAKSIERVEVVTAISITEEQSQAIKAKLEAITNKTVIVKNTVDPSILGGVILRYSGKQLDGSVKTRLDGFSKSLSNIVM